MITLRFLPLAVFFGSRALLSAQDAARPPPAPPEARQFDFWVGEWEVTTPDGKVAGHSRVELILGDRVILENWTGAKGYSGKSFNIYDASIGKWRQFWVDRSGLSLLLTGGLVDGSMVLSGERKTPEGSVIDRITWTHNEKDGTVRQVWEVSKNEGETWSTVFDGLYTRENDP